MGIMPSEYWEMTAGEFLVIAQMEADNAPVSDGGKMRHKDARELALDLDLSDEEWWIKHGPTKH